MSGHSQKPLKGQLWASYRHFQGWLLSLCDAIALPRPKVQVKPKCMLQIYLEDPSHQRLRGFNLDTEDYFHSVTHGIPTF